jgi:hypothetical protein
MSQICVKLQPLQCHLLHHKERGKRLGGRVKLGNFLPEEDVNLVKSWLEISTDVVTNTGKKRTVVGKDPAAVQ